MNDQELEQKNITISAVEDVQWGIKLKSESGEVFNVPKTLKGTETETKAFQVLKAMAGYGIGKQVSVKFATIQNGQGGQSRYVRIIASPEENNGKQTNHHKEHKNAPQGNFKPKNAIVEPDWDKISWGKCKYGFLIAFVKSGANIYEIDKLENLAEKYADMAMRKLDDNDRLDASLQAYGLGDIKDEEIKLNEPPL